jgi:hypothetical protein
MLKGLAPQASLRKLRLFACACCRLVWHLLGDERSERAVVTAEEWAEGLFPTKELRKIHLAAESAFHEGNNVRPMTGEQMAIAHARIAASFVARPARKYCEAAFNNVRSALFKAGGWNEAAADETTRVLAALLREVFCNPFRRVAVDPAWLTWRGYLVASMARRIYDERDFAALPVLGDALEDAGCTEAALLGHLRSPGPHVRGCWALDAILGRS